MLPHFSPQFLRDDVAHLSGLIGRTSVTLRHCVPSMFLLMGLLFIPMTGCAAKDARNSQCSAFISVMPDGAASGCRQRGECAISRLPSGV
jgi:hypothetical protein